LKDVFDEFKKKLDNEIDETKLAKYNGEKEILKEYNGRQFLEMLQNIDDQQSKKALIKLDRKNEVVTISNSGNPFSEGGLKSLMVAHISPKDKSFIGNKGLGFRSLLNWSEAIYVKSKELSIEFSKTNRDRLEPTKKRAILSSPEWIDKYNKREWIDNLDIDDEYITHIAINYKKELESRIIEQLSHISSELLLFINHLEEIVISIDDDKVVYKRECSWKIFTKEDSLPKELQDEDDENEHFQIKVAIPSINQKTNPFLFSYFPTKIKIDFPALIHSTFDLDASRERIVDSEKNRFIVRELAKFIIEVAEKLKNDNANWDSYKFLDIKHKNETLEEFEFYKIIDKYKESAEIYPCIDNRYRDKNSFIFFNNSFSNFMQNYSDICRNLLKENNYFDEFYNTEVDKEVFFKLNKKISSIEKRVELIEQISTIYDYIKLERNELPLLINQKKKLKSELFLYEDIFLDLDIPEFISIDYLYPELQEGLKDKINSLKKICTIKNFDLAKNLINPIIESKEAIQVKLKALYSIYQKFPKKLDIKKLDEVTGRYIREDLILKTCDEKYIIQSYKNLKIDKLNNINNLLLWLGAKRFNAGEILNIIVKENNKKIDIPKTLKELFYLKDNFLDNVDNTHIRTIEKIYVFNANGNIEDIQKLFPYQKNYDKSAILADKKSLGLEEFEDEEIENFFKWLKVKEFNPKNIAIEKIEQLRDSKLSKNRCKEIIDFLFDLREKKEIQDIRPDTKEIYLFNKKANSLYLRDRLSEKYFDENELILKDEKLTNEFFHWLGVKKAENNTVVKKIFQKYSLGIDDRLKDLINIYKRDENITRPDIEFKLKSQKGSFEDSRKLYINSENSEFFEKEKIVDNFNFEVSESFLKWLGLDEPKREDIVKKLLYLLSQKQSKEEIKKIVQLLEKKYEENDSYENDLYLLNNKNEIKKSRELYQDCDIAQKYLSDAIFFKKVDEKFLKFLKIKKAKPIEVIEYLLQNDSFNLIDIFELWQKVPKNIELNSKIKIELPNLKDEKININNLFLKKEVTPFYDENEIVATFEQLELKDYNENEIESFLVWLGVNRYIKYIEKESKTEIYKLYKIAKLDFEQIVKLLEYENFLSNKGALKYLQNAFVEYQFWILKDYGIKLINPSLEYENNPKRIEILEEFGIKKDFDKENSLYLIQNLNKLDEKGEFAPQIYKEILEHNFNFRYENFELFSKSKKYLDNKELYYLDNTKHPKAIENRYELIDLPINLDIDKIKNSFGVGSFPNIEYEIRNLQEINSSKFQNYFNKLKPYFLAFGAKNEQKIREKYAKDLNNLKIKFGNFESHVNNEKIEVENFEMIFDNRDKVFYIYADSISDNFSKDIALTDSVENILLTINFDNTENFRTIFRNADFEELDNVLNKHYGTNTLKDAKELVDNIEYKYKPNQNIVSEYNKDSIQKREESIDISKNNTNFNNKNNNSIETQEPQNEPIKERLNSFNRTHSDNNGNFKTSSKEAIKQEKKKETNQLFEKLNSNKESYSSKNNYSKPYNKAQNFQENNYDNFSKEDQDKFKYESGAEAESFVKEHYPKYIQVSGYAEGGNDSLGYDFEYTDDKGIEYFIEVKNFTNGHFWMTSNEIRVAKERGNRYHIYLVNTALKEIYDIGNIFLLKKS